MPTETYATPGSRKFVLDLAELTAGALDEFHGDVLVDGIVNRELRRNFQHVLTKHRHPGCAVCLFEVASGWKRTAAVED